MRTRFELRSKDPDSEAPPELVELARELVRLEPSLDDADRPILIRTVVAALAALENGSTRLPITELETASALLRAPALVSKDPAAYTPMIFDGEHLYLQRMLMLERRFAESFAAKVVAAGPDLEHSAVRRAVDEVRFHPLPLSDEQAAAVEKAVSDGLTVISGGPGTGKTSIVLALLRVLVRIGVEPEQIGLSAPTGKAANRMDESIRRHLERIEAKDPADTELSLRCPRAQTLHRMLGFSPKDASFRHHEENRLAQQVVIVDESSMIDLVLMEQLLRSVRPDARLVLLGDVEQLPSVEAGAVLRDIREAGLPSITLKKSFRMDEADPGGRSIMRAARAMNAGDAPALLEELRIVDRPEQLSFSGIELLEAHGDGRALLVGFLERFYRERIAAHRDWLRLSRHHYRFSEAAFVDEDRADLDAIFAHQACFKLLAVTRERAFSGATSLNESIHRMVLRDLKVPAAPFLQGEPAMMTKNDYERGLFNGDQGVILSVLSEGRPHAMAIFRTAAGYEPFHLQALRKDLSLAHAMTVHKSQGSEFDQVGVILPEVEIPLITRELLYTAVTRARRAVTIVGPRAPLLAAIGRRVERHSGLSEKMRAALQRHDRAVAAPRSIAPQPPGDDST